MAQIQVTNLTFSYDGSADDVFKDATFNIDTDWKLGLIGRNGKGKTTLLNLFMGRYDYRGSIVTGTKFDYFPYQVTESDNEKNAADLIEIWKPHVENWQVMIQMNQIGMDPECLYRPFKTLSFGERTRVMLAVLFADENEYHGKFNQTAEYEESEEAQKLATLKNGNIERLKLAVFTVKAHMGVDIDKIPSQ